MLSYLGSVYHPRLPWQFVNLFHVWLRRGFSRLLSLLSFEQMRDNAEVHRKDVVTQASRGDYTKQKVGEAYFFLSLQKTWQHILRCGPSDWIQCFLSPEIPGEKSIEWKHMSFMCSWEMTSFLERTIVSWYIVGKLLTGHGRLDHDKGDKEVS